MNRLFSTVIAEQHTEKSSYDWNNFIRPLNDQVIVIEQVIRGNLCFEVAGVVAPVGPGDAFIFSHGEASHYWIDLDKCDQVEIRYASFLHPPAGIAAADLRARLGQVFPLPDACEAAERFAQLIDAFEQELMVDRFLNSRVSYDFLMSLLSWSSREERVLDAVSRAREWLLDNYTRHVGVKELAFAVGVTREHITRAYRDRFGETPGAMLDRLRLSHAEQLLRLTQLSIHEIARRSGFAHADTLARHCKATYGVSPSQLREGGSTRAPSNSTKDSLLAAHDSAGLKHLARDEHRT